MAYECIEYCSDKREVCLEACNGNTICSFNCEYDASACTNSCPCFADCPLGCNGCLTPFCSCVDSENDPNYLTCHDFYESLYNECLFQCPTGDFGCLTNCYRAYEDNLETCPCRSQCPNGCPCPHYNCPDTPTTTTSITSTSVLPTTTSRTGSSVLILSTRGGYRAPIITDSSGRDDPNFFFRYGEDTSVYGSCSLTFRNQLYVFGGESPFKRQLSKLVGCQLQRVGSLAFDLELGSCASVADSKVYLCFNSFSSDTKKCRFASDPEASFTAATSSVYEHQQISIAASDCE